MRSVIRASRAGLLLSALFALLLLNGACSLLPGSEGSNPMTRSGGNSVGVVVENQHWSDMVIYVVSGGSARRLGMVTTANRRAFELSRDRLTSSLFLRAEVVGSSRSIRTDFLNVSEGDVVVWTLENQLRLSRYEIR